MDQRFSEVPLVEVGDSFDIVKNFTKLLVQALVRATCWETTLDNSQCFDKTTTAQLWFNVFSIEVLGLFAIVGFDATNEVWSRLLQSSHELFKAGTENVAGGPELAATGCALGCQNCFGDRAIAGGKQNYCVRVSTVHIFLDKFFCVVHNCSSVVLDRKAIHLRELRNAPLARCARVQGQNSIQARVTSFSVEHVVRKHLVLRNRTFWLLACAIQSCKNSTWSAQDQVNNVLVLWKINWGPEKSFTAIELLLSFQNVVVKELLQTFVGKIDAELLKRVIFENFETKHVQSANP
mmetsp:Transcript_4577/g.8740  ORF Transcript_4577/g.8740 Transcript_4577/m.8740 type:complete len:293 (-) Transcript_4577:1377-2255(-)